MKEGQSQGSLCPTWPPFISNLNVNYPFCFLPYRFSSQASRPSSMLYMRGEPSGSQAQVGWFPPAYFGMLSLLRNVISGISSTTHYFFPHLQIILQGFLHTYCVLALCEDPQDGLTYEPHQLRQQSTQQRHALGVHESAREAHTVFPLVRGNRRVVGEIKKIEEGFLEVTSAQGWEEWGHRLQTLTSMCPGFITMTSWLAVVYNCFALHTRPKACLQHLDPPFLEVSKILKGSGGPFSVYHSTKEILLYVFLQIIHNTAMGYSHMWWAEQDSLTTQAQYPEPTQW